MVGNFINTLFENYIDKVFVFVAPDDSITFILPWINFDYVFVTIIFLISISFVFELATVFISSWKRRKS